MENMPINQAADRYDACRASIDALYNVVCRRVGSQSGAGYWTVQNSEGMHVLLATRDVQDVASLPLMDTVLDKPIPQAIAHIMISQAGPTPVEMKRSIPKLVHEVWITQTSEERSLRQRQRFEDAPDVRYLGRLDNRSRYALQQSLDADAEKILLAQPTYDKVEDRLRLNRVDDSRARELVIFLAGPLLRPL